MPFIFTEQLIEGQFVQLQLANGSPLTAFGRFFPNRIETINIPAMASGALIEVGLSPDESFIGHTAVFAAFVGAPRPQLGIVGSWVGSTGIVYVRFIAGLGGVSAGPQDIGVVAFL
jgi:hypothetical protein